MRLAQLKLRRESSRPLNRKILTKVSSRDRFFVQAGVGRMSRLTNDRHAQEVAALRIELAGLAIGVKLIRLEHVLSRKYRPDQPRAPTGQSDGGRWLPEGTGGGSQAQSQTEDAVLEDGSRVLSIRIRAKPHTDWDEQHTVTGQDGTRTVFETSGLTQTIRDGDSNEILARSNLTSDGAEPEAFVQLARGRPRPSDELARRFARTLEAAGSLFSALSGRNTTDRKAIFAAPASSISRGMLITIEPCGLGQ